MYHIPKVDDDNDKEDMTVNDENDQEDMRVTIENCPPASASCRQMLGAQVTGNYCTVQSRYNAFTKYSWMQL